MKKTAQEIVQSVMDEHAMTDLSIRIGSSVRQFMEEAVEAAFKEARTSIVLTRSETLESDGIEVFDVDAVYSAPSDYDDEDVEALVARLREYSWPSVADDLEEWWARRSAERAAVDEVIEIDLTDVPAGLVADVATALILKGQGRGN